MVLTHSFLPALLLAPLPALAVPKVCGDQPALGAFNLATCPELKDDGVPPDATAGDGIYSAQATLAAADFLRFKILPDGAYGSNEIAQATTCVPAAAGQNPTRDVVVPRIAAGPALFFFDGRDLSADPSYAPVPVGARGRGGDSLMVQAPANAAPTWVAVGTFQASPYDPMSGLPLVATGQPYILSGEITAPRDLPAGWEWKVLEGTGSYTTARKFGANGWAYPDLKVGDNCDNQPARMGFPVAAGARLRFTFHAHLGRLQASVIGGNPDLASDPADLAGAADLARPADLGGGPAADLAVTPGTDGGGTPPMLGIRCAAAPGSRSPNATNACTPLLALALAAWARGRLRRDLRRKSALRAPLA